jgi:signal transduction histidine kinase
MWGYSGAVLVVAVALGLRLLLAPMLQAEAPFLLFVVAVLVASRNWGVGPGLLATGLSALAGTFFFLQPEGDLLPARATQWFHLGLFTALGVAVSGISGRLRSARESARDRLQERDLAEEEVRRLAAPLEQRVVERTAQLEEANQAMRAFAYSVSHDLRAPLRGIQGFAQALLEDYGERLDGTGHEYAQRIVAAAGRMDQLICDLLTYSRISRAELELQTVDLGAAVQEARQMAEEETGSHGAINAEGPFPAVRAHRPTLVQVLVNLLSNAIKFAAPGVEPQVRVWAAPSSASVRLWVEDNGIGILAEHQERIFGVFERLHGMETYPGTGVGLAVVRKGVERMGGTVGVESEAGRGSRFWIELRRSGGEP